MHGSVGQPAVGGPGGVRGLVESGAQGVAHAAVDGDEASLEALLDHADLVERDTGGADQRAARLHREPDGGRVQLLGDPGPQRGYELGGSQPLLAGHIGDPGAAAEVQLVDTDAVPLGEHADECGNPRGGPPDAGRVEDLRTQVGVDARQAQRGDATDGEDRPFGESTVDREAELHVVAAGGHVVVGVGGDARRDAQIHVLDPATSAA